ncbi:MAG: HD-GYP domain-containing protein, partial [Nitrosomonadales bacterium]|nr:HD-GYP domain-containing protein [Nitrosomonadales bacterium]
GSELLAYTNRMPPSTSTHSSLETESAEIHAAELRRKEDVRKIRQTYVNHGGITAEIVDYPIQVEIEKELTTAKETAAKFEREIASSLMLEMTGENLSDRIDVAKDLLADIVNSIIRNPDAMLLIRQLKDLDDLTYHHAMDVSIMLVSFGRQLGLPKKELNEIALGGLLHDIGKSRVPSEIINKKQRLNAEETMAARSHVNLGLEVIAGLENLSDIARQVIERHHERYDGKGYPTGLAAEDIGLYGSMAGIVETFSSITSDQPYSAARSSAQAVSTLVALRDSAFQSELVDQFIQVVGVYPIGSLVKLNTGEVGIVVKQNTMWRLKPMVSIVIDTEGRKLPSPMTIDLVRPPQLDAAPISIATELPAGAYGIHARDYFL